MFANLRKRRHYPHCPFWGLTIHQRPIDFPSIWEYLQCNRRVGLARNLISVIDDDEAVRRTTKLLIESSGYQAAAFESAENLLSSGQLDDTSCLIIDLNMPGMNGLQLQNHLAAAGSRIPIIFITAYDDKKSRRQAMRAGAVAFLAKPFTDQQLFQTIRSALCREKGGTAV